jgi:hypothetical protein
MPDRDEFFFPLQTIKQVWGREWELIATWAVGEDWSTTPFDRWPERMTNRTGVKVPLDEEMSLSLDRVRFAWDHRHDPAYKKPEIASEPEPPNSTMLTATGFQPESKLPGNEGA